MLCLIVQKGLFWVLWLVVEKQGSSPIEITTTKANFLFIRLLAFLVFGLGMELGMVRFALAFLTTCPLPHFPFFPFFPSPPNIGAVYCS